MTRKEIINGLKMSMDLTLFDPSTGEVMEPWQLNEVNRTAYEAYKGAIELLEEMPSAQPERPKGKWIHQVKFSRVECDQCGKVFRNSFAPKNFCPNCGADMRGEQNG